MIIVIKRYNVSTLNEMKMLELLFTDSDYHWVLKVLI